MKSKKTKRGGARANAGRHAKGTKPYTVRFYPAVMSRIRELARSGDQTPGEYLAGLVSAVEESGPDLF